jgi:ABC-type dipeptide/oligopeptide/nickel transport system permease component
MSTTPWWTRPLLRLVAAVAMPLLVPAIITAILWMLPGNPAEIICPPETCPATQALAQRWGLHQGPVVFYANWLGDALQGQFGNSWRMQQGTSVAVLVGEALPVTAELVLLALLLIVVGQALAAANWLPRKLDVLWQGIGLVPAVIFALLAAAAIEINFGARSNDGWPALLRLLSGATVLALADGGMAAAVVGTRSTFDDEFKQRYVSIAVLRGESPFLNALPNLLPALIGQLRGRILHILSGAVIVEVVLRISGLGELLFIGTLQQDFGVVLAATWAFCVLSTSVIVAQAMGEIAVAWYVRRHPAVGPEPGGGMSSTSQPDPDPDDDGVTSPAQRMPTRAS